MNLQWHVVWKTVWILISWLLQKPADLTIHCFQLRHLGQLKLRHLGQIKFSLVKYSMAINLSMTKFTILLFSG